MGRPNCYKFGKGFVFLMGKNGKKIDVIVLNSHGVGQICHGNDFLSAIVAAIIGADLLVLLSDIDGLYTDCLLYTSAL